MKIFRIVFFFKENGIGCPGVFDKIMCWPATAANTLINIPCPNFDGLFDEKSKHSFYM